MRQAVSAVGSSIGFTSVAWRLSCWLALHAPGRSRLHGGLCAQQLCSLHALHRLGGSPPSGRTTQLIGSWCSAA